MLFVDGREIQRGEIIVGLSHRANQFRLLLEQCSIEVQIGEEVLEVLSPSLSLSSCRSVSLTRCCSRD